MTTLETAIERFLNRYDNRHTVRAYKTVLEPFARDFDHQRSITTLTPEDLDAWDYAQRHTTPPPAPDTITSRRKKMKAFWNWCVQRELIDDSPARFLAIRRTRRQPGSKAIPFDVLERMLEKAQQKTDPFISPRDTAILFLLITFGARAGDVARLRLSGIDLAGGWITFQVKGNKDLRLCLPPRTACILSNWLAVRSKLDPDPSHNFVFTSNRLAAPQRYGPLKSSSISTLIKRLSEAVCGRQWGPHSIRHWRGQSLMDEGVAPTVVQHILGHSDVHITLTHYANQDRERVARALAENEFKLKTRSLSENDPFPAYDTTSPEFWRQHAG